MTPSNFLKVLIVTVGIVVPLPAMSQSKTVFSGIPKIKISEGGVGRIPEKLLRKNAVNVGCVISQIGDKFYWASRENKELASVKSSGFITFYAIDGSGYVRMTAPGMKEVVSAMSETESEFDYVEHLLIGLRSVTYYGVVNR